MFKKNYFKKQLPLQGNIQEHRIFQKQMRVHKQHPDLDK